MRTCMQGSGSALLGWGITIQNRSFCLTLFS